jgi:hypothetical protein
MMQDFNILSNYVLPDLNKKEARNSSAAKVMKENNIDLALLDNQDVDPNSEVITFDKEVSEENKTSFGQDFIKFVTEDLPRDTVVGIIMAGLNGTQKGFEIGRFIADSLGGQDMVQGATNWIDKIEKAKADFRQVQDQESPFISRMLSYAAQDATYVIPLHKKLKQLGLSNTKATILSFGLGGALAFDKNDQMFLDSDLIQGIRQLMDIDPNTPSEDMFNQVYSIAEQSGVGVLADNLFKAVKLIKQIEAKQAVQVTNSAGGAAVAGEAASKIENAINNNTEQQNSIMPTVEPNQDLNDSNFNIDQNLDLSAEKKNLNFDNNTNPERIEVASAGMGPIFKSVLQSFAKKIPNKGSGQQILSTIKNAPGVKEAELKWTGLDDFLKDKKSVTKEEVGEFLDRTRIDIEEVNFSKAAQKPTKELQELIDKFERKYFDQANLGANINGIGRETGVPNYDVYRVQFGNETSSMDYQTLQSILGNNVTPENFKTLPNGKLTLSNLRDFTSGMITEDATRFKKFEIDPIEIEKYKIERVKRTKNLNTNNAKFEQYTEPGGSDYTELVFTVKKGGMDKGIPTELTEASIVPKSGGESFKNIQVSKTFTPYKNPSHMNVKSEIAHVRFKTRELDGKKILTVEEMQSDFGIAASKAMANRPDIKITDFPFKNTWYELVTKRLIRHAADNGFDAVAIPKGSTIANRYKQELINSKNIKVYKFKDEISVHYLDDAGEAADIQKFIPDKEGMAQLQKTLGLKIYDKIINLKNSNPQTFPIDKPVSIGEGKGKADLYDKAIPSFMKKYGKKWNAKVYDKNIDKYLNIHDKLIYEDSSKLPVTILEITPEMKKSVQQDGQALFNLFGIAGGSAVGAKAVSDNMKNNTISKPTNN